MQSLERKNGPPTSAGQSQVWCSKAALDAMLEAATRAHPLEACGILLGEEGRIAHLIETRNVHPDPETHFEIEPQALINAHRDMRAGGPQILGYFHSHPQGSPAPSDTDRAMAAHDGMIWAIVSAGGLGLWRDDLREFTALSYRVLER